MTQWLRKRYRYNLATEAETDRESDGEKRVGDGQIEGERDTDGKKRGNLKRKERERDCERGGKKEKCVPVEVSVSVTVFWYTQLCMCPWKDT